MTDLERDIGLLEAQIAFQKNELLDAVDACDQNRINSLSGDLSSSRFALWFFEQKLKAEFKKGE